MTLAYTKGMSHQTAVHLSAAKCMFVKTFYGCMQRKRGFLFYQSLSLFLSLKSVSVYSACGNKSHATPPPHSNEWVIPCQTLGSRLLSSPQQCFQGNALLFLLLPLQVMDQFALCPGRPQPLSSKSFPIDGALTLSTA